MIRAHFESIYDCLLDELAKARHSVRLCVAWMNPALFAHVFQGLLDRGVQIEIAYYDVLQNQRLGLHFRHSPIRFYPVTPRGYRAYMHHKFCIIDDEVLITGSYNWTKNAARGFENIIVATHEFDLVKQYKHEFEDVKEYVLGGSTRRTKLCSQHPYCRSEAYYLAVLYPDDGYARIATGIWQVCERAQHAKLVSSDPHIDDEFEVYQEDFDEPTGRGDTIAARREDMRHAFEKERESISRNRDAIAKRFGMSIDAYGTMRVKNEAIELKGGGGGYFRPEHEILVEWRDVYYRKTIPDVLSEDGGHGQIIRGETWTW